MTEVIILIMAASVFFSVLVLIGAMRNTILGLKLELNRNDLQVQSLGNDVMAMVRVNTENVEKQEALQAKLTYYEMELEKSRVKILNLENGNYELEAKVGTLCSDMLQIASGGETVIDCDDWGN